MARRLLPRERAAAGGAATGPGVPFERPPFTADSPGLRSLAAVHAAAGRDRSDAPLPRPAVPGPAARPAHLRYAALLALCVLISQGCAAALHGPRDYWLPMTVAFVYKPDFGPVFRRALHRCAGTVAGVAVIGALTLATGDTLVSIAAVAGFGALMAAGVRHHYAVATTGLTAAVFVMLDLLGDHRELYGPRIVDTALAAGIVLFVHFAVWPDSAARHADEKTAAALAAARRYQDLAAGVAPPQRHALRRSAYGSLAEARRAAATARHEPSRPGRPLPDWEQAIARTEQLCDAVTARALDGPHQHARSA
jgi:uncharacterized membrane protein YccC